MEYHAAASRMAVKRDENQGPRNMLTWPPHTVPRRRQDAFDTSLPDQSTGRQKSRRLMVRLDGTTHVKIKLKTLANLSGQKTA